MVKETSKWSREGQFFETQGYRRNKKQGGMWELEDLPTLVDRFLYKITNRKLSLAMEEIKEAVLKESSKLFTFIANNSVNRSFDYYEGTPYTNKIWERLGDDYARRKGHRRFWFYDKPKRKAGETLLRDWLLHTPTVSVMGNPRVEVNRNPSAHGYQYVGFTITPFPNSRRPRIEEDLIRYKLFGRHKWGGTFMSNEEARPIVSPAIRALTNSRIRERVMYVLKEAIEND